jgi:hypothetical protein
LLLGFSSQMTYLAANSLILRYCLVTWLLALLTCGSPEAGFLVRVHPEPCLIMSRAQIRALLCSLKSKFIPAQTLTSLVLDKKNRPQVRQRYSNPAKTDVLHSNTFRAGQNRPPLFPCLYIHALTDFLRSKPLQSGQKTPYFIRNH